MAWHFECCCIWLGHVAVSDDVAASVYSAATGGGGARVESKVILLWQRWTNQPTALQRVLCSVPLRDEH
jgi:hypothetical protein